MALTVLNSGDSNTRASVVSAINAGAHAIGWILDINSGAGVIRNTAGVISASSSVSADLTALDASGFLVMGNAGLAFGNGTNDITQVGDDAAAKALFPFSVFDAPLLLDGSFGGGIGSIRIPSSTVGTTNGGAPWAVTQTTTQFAGTTDNLLLWGYNPSNEFSAALPAWWNQIEIDYNDGTNHWLEQHIDSVIGGSLARHWIIGRKIDVPTRFDFTAILGTNTGSLFSVQDSNANHLLDVLTTGNTDRVEINAISTESNGCQLLMRANNDTTPKATRLQVDTAGNFVIEMLQGGQMYFDYRTQVNFRNAGAGEAVELTLDASGNLVATGMVTATTVKFSTALVALGGGASATLGTIGGSGPVSAAQNTWLLLKDSTGASFWVPAWK